MDRGGDRFPRKDGGGKQQETYSGSRGDYRERSSSMPQREFLLGDGFRRGRESNWREEETRYQRDEQKRKFAFQEGGSGQRFDEEDDRFYNKDYKMPQIEREEKFQPPEHRDLRNRLQRDREIKEKWVKQEESGSTVPSKKRCFNCNETGYHHTQCVNPPFCYSCKKTGHKAHNFLDKIELKNCGFGMPGMGFYSIHIPVSE